MTKLIKLNTLTRNGVLSQSQIQTSGDAQPPEYRPNVNGSMNSFMIDIVHFYQEDILKIFDALIKNSYRVFSHVRKQWGEHY